MWQPFFFLCGRHLLEEALNIHTQYINHVRVWAQHGSLAVTCTHFSVSPVSKAL